MKYCKYHPLTPANYYCDPCDIDLCEQCVDEGQYAEYAHCFLCEKNVNANIGGGHQVEAFWHRFDKSFRYPLNVGTIIFIVGLSILMTVATFIPFAWVIQLALSGALFKYSFSCLEKTASGMLLAPDISDAYGDGSSLMLRLLVIFLLIIGSVVGLNIYFQSTLILVISSSLAVIFMPAVFIIFALEDDILAAINPLKQFKLISAIGLPYTLLLIIILIMSASVGLINELIGGDFSFVSLALQSMAGNYYTIVLFHIMGYMIYQYHYELGFAVSENNAEGVKARNDVTRLLSKIKIMIKEGRYDKALTLFAKGASDYPEDNHLNYEFFKFLLGKKSHEDIERYAPVYLKSLSRNDQTYKLMLSYKRLLDVNASYFPDSAELRFSIAQACQENGDLATVVKLINGMHKTFPEFKDLIPAYELMAQALDELPERKKQAAQCREFIKHLEKNIDAIKPRKKVTPEVKNTTPQPAWYESDLKISLVSLDEEK